MKPIKLLHPVILTLACTVGLSVSPNLVLAQSSRLPAESQAAVNQSDAADPLKAGDRVLLTVLGFPELSGEQSIGTDGMLQIPLVGSLSVGGLTSAQAANRLTQALLPYVRRPQVGLSILSLSPLHISVTGEVLQPGARSILPSETANNAPNNAPITLSKALVLAGGITPSADLRNIVIRRTVMADAAIGSLPETTQTELKVNFWKVIQSGDLANDLRIYDGDEIVVPKARSSGPNQQMLLASTVAPAKVTVRVAGEVGKPGEIEIAPAAGVNGAVAAAGGLSNDARKDGIILFRMAPNGQIEQKAFAFEEATEPLMNGDLIVVDKSSRGDVGNVFDFLGRLILPIAPLLRLF
jgi:polysaccharide biosynthesis/export protein